jgi:Big-like domain-containing protein/BACON domain-containing protein
MANSGSFWTLAQGENSMVRLMRRPVQFTIMLVSASLLVVGFGTMGFAGSLTMTWQNNATDATGNDVDRGPTATGPFSPLAVGLPASATTYTDATVSPATQYCYRVYAYNGAGSSSYSNVACATTPEIPTSLTVTAPTVTEPANAGVTVTVAASSGAPTGTVSLAVDGGALMTASLSSGQTTFTLTSPSPGAHALVGSYAAQNGFGASSATGTLTVNPAAPPAPSLSVSPSALGFAKIVGQPNPPAQSVMVTVPAGQSWTASTAAAWVGVSPASGTGPGTIQVTPSIGMSALAAGSYTSSIAMSSAGLNAVAALSVVVSPASAAGTAACNAPPLPITGTRIINVSTESQLQTAVANAQTGDTIVLADGTYVLTSTLYLNNKQNVTIRGTAGCDGVALVGKGMDNASYGNVLFGIWSNSLNSTIAHLTIRDTYDNLLVFNPGAQSPHVYSVRLLNAGSQFIKANPTDAPNGVGVDNGIVEYSWMEYTSGPPATNHGSGIGYTNGISAHAADGWIIRKNMFKNFHTPDSAAYLWNPAVLMWNHSANTLTEQNTFINVDRAIAYGLTDQASGYDHQGGTIRNNFVYMAPGLFSAGRTAGSDGQIIVWDSPGTMVYHNTVLTSANVASAIEFRFAGTTGGEVRNNLADARINFRDGATATVSGNLLTATSGMFVNPAAGDLHLLSTATAAIDKAPALAAVINDFDGDSRPQGSAYDIGADEFRSTASIPTSLSLTAPPVTAPANASVTVTVTAGGSTPTGMVSLTVDGSAPLTASLSAGQATFTLSSPVAGSHTLVGSYAAQNGFGASTASGTVQVNPAPSLSLAPSALSFTTVVGQPNPLSQNVTVTVPAGQSWTASTGATWVSVSPTSGTGPGTMQVTPSSGMSGLAAGSYSSSIAVSSAGLSASVSLAVVVSPASASTTVDFDNPAPPGQSGSTLAVFGGINWGSTWCWWSTEAAMDNTNHADFCKGGVTARTFAFSPGPKTLTTITLVSLVTGKATISDNTGQKITATLVPGQNVIVTTNWKKASTWVKVSSAVGWDMAVTALTYK